MKVLLLAMLISLSLGCTTDQCLKARLGLATVQIGMAAASASNPAVLEYWMRYKDAAQQTYNLYCPAEQPR